MENFILMLGWAGVFAPMALGSIGSGYGCSVAGQAACGAMLDSAPSGLAALKTCAEHGGR